MSPVAGTVAKVGILLVVVVGATFIFRQDTRRRLSEQWAMQKCPGHVEADIRVIVPWADPKVDHCEGTPVRATCSVETTERSGRKTAPVKNWDCTNRHITAKVPALTPAKSPDQVRDQLERVRQEVLEPFAYVKAKLRERRELLGEPDPFPMIPGLGVEP